MVRNHKQKYKTENYNYFTLDLDSSNLPKFGEDEFPLSSPKPPTSLFFTLYVLNDLMDPNDV